MVLTGCHHRVMTQKKPRKESAKAVLAGVRKEMARPRVAESAQKKAPNPAAVRPTHRLSY
jgi:hypothetical protein